jgi:hypothetical protein
MNFNVKTLQVLVLNRALIHYSKVQIKMLNFIDKSCCIHPRIPELVG